MNGEERNSLEVLRAEVTGKLDLLIERTGNLKDDLTDHELRLRLIEEQAVPAARAAANAAQQLTDGLDDVKRRMWMAVGAIGMVVFLVNIAVSVVR